MKRLDKLQRKRRHLVSSQNRLCCYCHIRFSGRPPKDTAATVEHRIPRGQHGTDDLSNLLASCLLCNNGRGDLDHDFYVELVAKHGRTLAAQLANSVKSKRDKEKLGIVFADLTAEEIEADRKTIEASMALLASVPPMKIKPS